MNRINEKHGVDINYENRQRIFNIFDLIDKVKPEVNSDHKRMISVAYVLRRLFEILGLPYDNIKTTTSKKTLNYYNQWWNEVYGLIKHHIHKVINK